MFIRSCFFICLFSVTVMAVELQESVELIQKEYDSCKNIGSKKSEKKIGSVSHFWVTKENTSDFNFKLKNTHDALSLTHISFAKEKQIDFSNKEALALDGFLNLGLTKQITIGSCLNGFLKGIFLKQ